MPTTSLDSSRVPPLDRDLLRLMAVLLLGAQAALLDTTIVAIALDDVARTFDTTVAVAQWATSGYLLAMTSVIPLLGWLVDRWGGRRVWLGAISIFLLGSVLCALAWSIESLIAFRVVQGLGGGLVLPLVQTILARAAGPARIGRVMGLVGIPGQLAPILGPVLGGLLLGLGGWRWLFLVNVPICVAALLLAHRYLRVATDDSHAHLDRIGVLLLTSAAVSILAGLSAVPGEIDTVVPPGVLIAAGLLLLGVFVLHARGLGHRALVDVGLLRLRSFAAATTAMFLFGLCLYGPMLLLPLFYQRVHGFSETEVGLLLVPQGVGTMIALAVIGRWVDRTGPRGVAVLGVVLACAGVALIASTGPAAAITTLSAAIFLLGAGIGSLGVAVSAASYRDLEPAAFARGTSLTNVVQRLGASFGTVVVALILESQTTAAGTESGAAFAVTFWWILGFAAVTFVPAAFLPGRQARRPGPVEDPRSVPCVP
ncbi:hypothetical protein ACG83_17065 [Frankia sp. R43]|nr:hypothetical protein ACG83_17065 [Frankia sp. R43]